MEVDSVSKTFSEEVLSAVMIDYCDGMKHKEIARKYGMSPTTVLKYVKNRGLGMRVDHEKIKQLNQLGMKVCPKGKYGCGETLSIDQFNPNCHYCKKCSAKTSRSYHKTDRGQIRWRSRNYQKCFGITIDDYEKMLKAQDGKCAICQRRPGIDQEKRLHVDHCHTTGKVRGLLCSKCNCGIGHLADSPERLRKAASYIEYYATSKNT